MSIKSFKFVKNASFVSLIPIVNKKMEKEAANHFQKTF